MDERRRAYRNGLVDPRSITWEDVEEALSRGKEGTLQRSRFREPLITDLRKAMGWMECFSEYREERQEESDLAPKDDMADLFPIEYTVQTVRRTAPKVGRNDPCPCGSDRKYKRCYGLQ